MEPKLSVIICTHNPRRDYLNRVLESLKSQTLPVEEWELLLIDNASNQRLAAEIDLSWQINARHIREEKLGLTPARLCGIQEAKAETLVFVDDDNVLDTDYLEVALQISETWSVLGAWGGQARPEFEETPPEWTKSYWHILAICEFDHDKWSNSPHINETTPSGAGMCIRKVVAKKYAELVDKDPQRAKLDRKGKQLMSGGDSDLALTSCELGLGTGKFVDLKLTHLIPKQRLQEEYIVRLVEGIMKSATIVNYLRGKMPEMPGQSLEKKLIEYYKYWRTPHRERRFYQAYKRGISLAIKEISNL